MLIASVPSTAVVFLYYRKELMGTIPNYDQCLKITDGYRILDWNLMAKCGYVVTVVVIGFLLVSPALSDEWVAGAAA